MLTKKNNMRSDKKPRLIFCSFVPVGLEDYVQYFINNFSNFTYLKWKFPHSKGSMKSSLTNYKDGQKIKERYLFSIVPFQKKYLYFSSLPLNYLIYLQQALSSFWRRKDRDTTVFVGENYFCTFCGILLKEGWQSRFCNL